MSMNPVEGMLVVEVCTFLVSTLLDGPMAGDHADVRNTYAVVYMPMALSEQSVDANDAVAEDGKTAGYAAVVATLLSRALDGAVNSTLSSVC